MKTSASQSLEWLDKEQIKAAIASEEVIDPTFAAIVEDMADGEKMVRLHENRCGGISMAGFEESDKGGLINEITVIEKGWSLNGHYYGDNAINQIAESANDMVVGYLNHGDTFSRDPREWAITTESGRREGDAVRSKIHIFAHPDGDFIKERIAYAKQHKADHLFGVSIDAFAQVSEGEADGREGQLVENIIRLNSVDIVMEPAAKGSFNAAESVQSHPSPSKEKRKMDAKTLRDEYPDTAKLIAEEAVSEARADFEGEKTTLHEALEAAEKEKAGLVEELAQAQAKVDEFEQAARQAEFVQQVESIVSELPEEKRTNRFTGILVALGPDRIETIKEMVEERKESNIAPIVTGEGVGGVTEAVKENIEVPALPSEDERLKLLLGA